MLVELAQEIVRSLDNRSADHITRRIMSKTGEYDLDWVQALGLIGEVERLTGVAIFPPEPQATTTATGAENK
ncbi:MAG: hypothetical protein NVV74_07440 [Magnetospirillum sp.]|nr:hypothetical protein [Magnetospirillum sp.]